MPFLFKYLCGCSQFHSLLCRHTITGIENGCCGKGPEHSYVLQTHQGRALLSCNIHIYSWFYAFNTEEIFKSYPLVRWAEACRCTSIKFGCMQCTCTNRGTLGSLLTASRADTKGEKGEVWVIAVRSRRVNGKENTALEGKNRKDWNNSQTDTDFFVYTCEFIKEAVDIFWGTGCSEVAEGTRVNLWRCGFGDMYEKGFHVNCSLAAVYWPVDRPQWEPHRLMLLSEIAAIRSWS